jgi:pyrroline-5-carboxylate reductase
MNISFIGGGNMARAIIGGLQKNGFDTRFISVIDPDTEKCGALNTEYAVQLSNSYVDKGNNEIIVLAVKPQQLRDVCIQLKNSLSNQLIISIAAGVRIKDIARWLGGYDAIVRVMPNTPAQIQAGVSALYASKHIDDTRRNQAASILAAVGKVLWLEDESQMDAVTAISGSGPAYVFYFIEALQQAGIQLGLSPEASSMLALETFAGASQLAVQSPTSVETLRAQVTSKGGTTEQGILALEQAGVKQAIENAAKAAAQKSLALGDILGND